MYSAWISANETKARLIFNYPNNSQPDSAVREEVINHPQSKTKKVVFMWGAFLLSSHHWVTLILQMSSSSSSSLPPSSWSSSSGACTMMVIRWPAPLPDTECLLSSAGGSFDDLGGSFDDIGGSFDDLGGSFDVSLASGGSVLSGITRVDTRLLPSRILVGFTRSVWK